MTYTTTLLLVELAMFGQLLVQLSLRSELDDKEYPLRIVEVSVQPQDVWVSA